VVSFQEGEPLKGLTASKVYFAIAKLVPAGTHLAAVPPQTSAPATLPGAQWQSYIYASVSPAPASAGTATEPVVGTSPQLQATIAAGATGKLADNGDGTYKYTLKKRTRIRREEIERSARGSGDAD
jgi:hypothetical protein